MGTHAWPCPLPVKPLPIKAPPSPHLTIPCPWTCLCPYPNSLPIKPYPCPSPVKPFPCP